MGVTLIGGASGVGGDVGSNTKALRVEPRPIDIGSLGSYAGAWTSGTIAAGAAANSIVFSCRWTNATNGLLLRRLTTSMSSLGTGFTAGVGVSKLFATRSFTASDSAQTSVLPTGNSQKRKTGFATTGITDLRISNTAAITAGTGTDDGAELANLMFAIGTAANTVYLPTANLWTPDFAGEWPLVLLQNEGFRVRYTVPATGTWQTQINMEWSEVVPGSGYGF